MTAAHGAPSLPAHRSAEPTPTVVLDTNAVLDWLVFNDAGMHALGAAIIAGRVRWAACPAMRQELAHMLAHASLARWQPDLPAVMATLDRTALHLPAPWPGFRPGLRCTDPDDQVFVDLALETRARWLVTHDRALLKLARQARRLGLSILTPSQWQETAPGSVA